MVRPLLIATSAAIGGIVWRWAEDYRSGRRFGWRRVVLDLGSSIGIGMSAWSVASWLNLPESASVAIACGLGTLGRNGVIELILRFYGRDGNKGSKDR